MMQPITRRAMIAAGLALLLTAGTAQAQGAVLGFYLVPKIGTGTTPLDPVRPKYIGDLGVFYSAVDLGLEPTFLVGAVLTPAQHTAVTSNSDVFAFPDINTQVGGNPTLNRVRNELEQRNLPGNWIDSATAWRDVIGSILRNAFILQRLRGTHKTRLFEPGVSLDSVPSQNLLDQLVDVGQSFGLAVEALSLALTVRADLEILTDQMPPITLIGEVF